MIETHRIDPCQFCDTWRHCFRHGCAAYCEKSARALAEKEEEAMTHMQAAPDIAEPKPRTMRELLETYRRGDSLTDDELTQLRHRMARIADLTADLGDLFQFSCNYAATVARNCGDYLTARDRAGKEPRTPNDPQAWAETPWAASKAQAAARHLNATKET